MSRPLDLGERTVLADLRRQFDNPSSDAGSGSDTGPDSSEYMDAPSVLADSDDYFMTPLLNENMEIDGKKYVLFRNNDGKMEIIVMDIPNTDAFVSRVKIDPDIQLVSGISIDLEIEASSTPGLDHGTIIAVMQDVSTQPVDQSLASVSASEAGEADEEIAGGAGVVGARAGGSKKTRGTKASNAGKTKKITQKKK